MFFKPLWLWVVMRNPLYNSQTAAYSVMVS